MPKKFLPIALTGLTILIIAGFIFARSRSSDSSMPEVTGTQKQLINVLPIKDRPFVALFPHETNKLITLYIVNKNQSTNLSVEIEYLSGNSLKGGRGSVPVDASFPYTKAFLLGSCSAGGKCSFDTEITTGTVKTKLSQNGENHVLRSNYTFTSLTEISATVDRKITFTPQKLKDQLIVGSSHGFLEQVNGEAAAEPVYVAATTADKITGKLTLVAPEAKALQIFDGESYQPLTATQTEAGWEIAINHIPRSIPTTIIRDDLKGSEEKITLYLLGPIVATK